MSASKIGSPFRHGNVAWLDKGAFYCGSNHPKIQEFAEAAIEAWTPTPPEGWEEYPENERPVTPEAFWNPLVGVVCTQSDLEAAHYVIEGVSWHRSYMFDMGFVPVRKTKPAVPKWAKNLENGLRGIDEDYWGDYLAKYCVPKADADEMLAALKALLSAYRKRVPNYHDSEGVSQINEAVALIERMEGKR